MAIAMAMGVIRPLVRLNVVVNNSVAPDIPLSQIIWRTMPFPGLMFFAVPLCCLFPGIVTWLPAARHELRRI